jgi:hypothetical protein
VLLQGLKDLSDTELLAESADKELRVSVFSANRRPAFSLKANSRASEGFYLQVGQTITVVLTRTIFKWSLASYIFCGGIPKIALHVHVQAFLQQN